MQQYFLYWSDDDINYIFGILIADYGSVRGSGVTSPSAIRLHAPPSTAPQPDGPPPQYDESWTNQPQSRAAAMATQEPDPGHRRSSLMDMADVIEMVGHISSLDKEHG